MQHFAKKQIIGKWWPWTSHSSVDKCTQGSTAVALSVWTKCHPGLEVEICLLHRTCYTPSAVWWHPAGSCRASWTLPLGVTCTGCGCWLADSTAVSLVAKFNKCFDCCQWDRSSENFTQSSTNYCKWLGPLPRSLASRSLLVGTTHQQTGERSQSIEGFSPKAGSQWSSDPGFAVNASS